jgi:hypothetical protein
MKGLTVKLTRLSICPCGEPVLMDEIPLGTTYRVYPETIRRGFSYRCGKCGRLQYNVQVISADNRDGSGRGELPLALFDLAEVAA